jgi:hypothetical protein
MKLHINVSNVDDTRANAPSNFIEMSQSNDSIIMSNGSDVVADGEVIPTEGDLIAAMPLIDPDVAVPIAHYFLADDSADLLREIHLAGNQNRRYVFCVEFEEVTASEPVLQIWDDVSYASTDFYCLGAGTPNVSFFQGVVTTDTLPGTNWTGTRLAGASSNHFLFLNNQAGPITEAKDVYFNLKETIPAAFANAVAEAPLFVIKYASN